MKNSNKLALLLSTGLLLPFAASAKTLEQSYLETCRKGPGVPVPISVVAPRVYSYDIGETVMIGFVVDAAGLPENVTVKSGTDEGLAIAAVDAIKQWRFVPAQKNGLPVASTVVLPIRVVDSAKASASLAMD